MQRIKRFILLTSLNLALVATPFIFAKAWHIAQARTIPEKALADAAPLPGAPPSVLPAGPNDANITRLTATILEHSQFLHHPLDHDMGSKFLDRYLETLDGTRVDFLQPDVDQFSDQYRASVAELTRNGDTTPGRVIFARFLERFQQRVNYVIQVLQNEKFDFTLPDRYQIDRKKSPYPADLAQAKELWRKNLKYEFLQERLQFKSPNATNHTAQAPAAKDSLKNEPGATRAPGQARLSSPPRAAAPSAPAAETELIKNPKLDKEDLQIANKLAKRYKRLLHTLREYDSDDILELYLSSLTHVYDPHSDYMGKSQLENFAISMKLSLCGIGALLGLEDGYCKILSLVPGGPAALSKKLHENDRIVAVAQGDEKPVDVMEESRLMRIVEMIRGPKDSVVRLTIIPADAPDPSVRKEVRLVRNTIPLENQEAKAKIFDLPDGPGKTQRLGLIDLPSFYRDFNLDDEKSTGKSTTVDVAKLLRKLKQENVSGVILDLRHNGGGSLEEAITLTGLFIKEGPVVQVKDPNGKVVVDSDDDPTELYDGPMIVLTDRFSASASEILAGALQDYGRALIVGDASTHGKGTVQTLIKLEPFIKRFLKGDQDPGALKLTIRKFYRITGSSTQLKGVAPDIILPSINTELETGEKSLEDPLPWDTISSQPFDKVNMVAPELAALKKNSERRVAADQDFIYIRDDIARLQKALKDKSVSLNEADRLKEKQEAEARLKKREAEIKARPSSPEKIYDITLKRAEQPGLPAPENGKSDPNKPDLGVAAEDETDAKPAIDADLKETKRIMADYIHMLAHAPIIAGAASAAPTPATAPDAVTSTISK